MGGTDVEELLYIAGPEEVLVLVAGPGLWMNVCVCVGVCYVCVCTVVLVWPDCHH